MLTGISSLSSEVGLSYQGSPEPPNAASFYIAGARYFTHNPLVVFDWLQLLASPNQLQAGLGPYSVETISCFLSNE